MREPEQWRWLDDDHLVLDEGTRPVVLCARDSALMTCDSKGLLEALNREHPRARMIEAAPVLYGIVKSLVNLADQHAKGDPMGVAPVVLRQIIEHGSDHLPSARWLIAHLDDGGGGDGS